MTDAQPLTQEAPKVPTLKEARAELAQLETWLQDLATRQSQQAGVLIRAGELRGVIATHEQYQAAATLSDQT